MDKEIRGLKNPFEGRRELNVMTIQVENQGKRLEDSKEAN